jgi:hypothetical protein
MAESQKLGATALSGYFRQGLAELRAAAPLADSPVAQATNYAMPGMATQGEIAEARKGESMDIDENSVVGSRINRLGPPRDDPGRDDPDKGPERD